jgi:uncharacterized protein YkwD
MKKFLMISGVILLSVFLCAMSCADETTDDDGGIVVTDDNKTPDNNKTPDSNKTPDNQTADNNNNKPSDNKTNEDNKPNDGGQSNEGGQTNDGGQVTAQGFTDAEIAKANTAAGISSLSEMERDVILYCNLARLDGEKFWAVYGKKNAKGSAEYVSSLESDLKAVKNLPMLMPEKSLMEAAAFHANDMKKNNFFEHTSSDGTSFGNRVRSYYGGNAIAENISAGLNTAIEVVMQLLVDDQLSSLGHRKNILGQKYVAIGVKNTTHPRWRYVTVQDFGDKVITKME